MGLLTAPAVEYVVLFSVPERTKVSRESRCFALRQDTICNTVSLGALALDSRGSGLQAH